MKENKTDHVFVECVVETAESNGFFKCHLQDNPNVSLFGYVSGKMRKNKIFVIPGDIVEIKLSIYDLTKGIISKRLKNGDTI